MRARAGIGGMMLGAGLCFCAPVAQARDFCPDRPGLGTSACTIDPDRVAVELSFADRTWDRQPDVEIDTIVAGDIALRAGVDSHTELLLAWTPYGFGRERDRATGEVERTSGIGDVTVGFKRVLTEPDSEGAALAVMGTVSLPTGGETIGAGDWGASFIIPFSLPVAPGLSFDVTAEVDAAVDGDRHGRHAVYGAVGGFTIEPMDSLGLSFELGAMRNEDPEETVTELIACISAGLMLGENVQVDAGTEIALNRNVPDNRVYFGIARRF